MMPGPFDVRKDHSHKGAQKMPQRVFVTCCAGPAFALALAGCTSSANLYTHESTAQCLAHAKQVLYDSDFNENPVVLREIAAVSGHRGGYKATIYCEGGGLPTRVDIQGYDGAQTDYYRDLILRKF